MSCTINDLGLNGYNNDSLGRPRDFVVYARVGGACATVRFEVRLTPNGLLLTTADAPVQNGVASAAFSPASANLPCGQRMWVSATCMPAGDCASHSWVRLQCKAGAIVFPGPGTPGSGGGSGDSPWPWPWPPIQFCPLIGRTFTEAFAIALLVVVLGVALATPPLIATGLALIAIALASLAIWNTWCAPPRCMLWASLLWCLKRAAVGALVAGIGFLSVASVLLAFVFGIGAGILTAKLRERRCFIPLLTTPLTGLPLW